MDFLTLSLPEALMTYMGLALQGLVRESSLHHVPGVMVLCWSCALVWRAHGHPLVLQYTLGGYLGASMLILVLFWPEACYFGRGGRLTDPSQVASTSAAADPEAQVVTAADTQQVPSTLTPPTIIPPAMRLLLRVVTETPLAFARAINTHSTRTFSAILPTSWLLRLQLPTTVETQLLDWVTSCYEPVMHQVQTSTTAQTQEDFLPWGDTVAAQALAARQVPLGASSGIVPPDSLPGIGALTAPQVSCRDYLAALEFQVQSYLFDTQSPGGHPLTEVFQQEMGLESQQQARFLVYRELLRVLPAAIASPSLTGALVGTSMAQGLVGAVSGAMSSLLGALTGSGTGAVSGMTNQLQQLLSSLGWLVQVAVFLVWFAPYVMGMAQMTMLALFPFVVLWALIPRSQFLPLAYYAVGLVFVYGVPLYWALIDVAQKLAGQAARPAVDPLLGLQGWAQSALWSTLVTVLGLLVIPLVCSLLFFANLARTGSLWRGGVS